MISSHSCLPAAVRRFLVASTLGLLTAQASVAAVQSASLSFSPGGVDRPTIRAGQDQVRSGEVIRTEAAEIRSLTLPDNTGIVLAAESEVVIERYAFEPASRRGELSLRVARGKVKIVGGAINNRQPILVETPDATLAIENATALVDVRPGRTRTNLMIGDKVTVTCRDRTQEVLLKPGFQVVSAGGTCTPPARALASVTIDDQLAFSTGRLGTDDRDTRGNKRQVALRAGEESRLATEDQPLAAGQLEAPVTPTVPTAPAEPGAPITPPTPAPTTGFDISDALNRDDGFGAGGAIAADGVSTRNSSTAVEPRTGSTVITVNDEDVEVATAQDESNVTRINTTNRLYASQSAEDEDFTQSLVVEGTSAQTPENPQQVRIDGGENGTPTSSSLVADSATPTDGDKSQRLMWVFATAGGRHSPSLLALAREGRPSQDDYLPGADLNGPPLESGLNASFVIGGPLPTQVSDDLSNFDVFDLDDERNGRLQKFVVESGSVELEGLGSEIRIGSILAEKDRELKVDDLDPLQPVVEDGYYVILQDGDKTDYRALQAGFNNNGSSREPAGTAPLIDVARNHDYFLLIQARGLNNGEDGGPGNETFLFANGGVSTADPGFSVDRFYVSPGLGTDWKEGQTTPLSTVDESTRAFLRKETALDLPLQDSGVLVVNPATKNDPSTLVHVDFGFEGLGRSQRSTVSLTLGDLKYAPYSARAGFQSANVEAVTIGSYLRARDSATKDNGSVHLYNGNLFSSSSGSGNPALPPGRAGYLVLENFIDPNDPSQGGLERPVGVVQGQDSQAADQRFGLLRLLSANHTSQPEPATRTSTTMTGWAAGYLEQERGSRINLRPFNSGATADNPLNSRSPGDVAFQAANLSVTTDKDLNRAAASIASGGTGLDLGGLSRDAERPSAYVDGKRFAAAVATEARQVGLVSGGLVKDHAALKDIPNHEHVKWGFFFGDTITAEGRREHVHLGSWAAGVPGDITGVRGTATYDGHAIGNVYNDGAFYTAVGSYTNTWDFDRRTGSVGMDFDGHSYSGSTAITANPSFVGTLNAGDRAGGLSGQFVRGGGDPVAGVVGQFSVQSVNDNAGVYRGVGTFGAEKRR